MQLITFLNIFYGSLDKIFSKFRVYNVHNMADEFMVVSGMPERIGKLHYMMIKLTYYCELYQEKIMYLR